MVWCRSCLPIFFCGGKSSGILDLELLHHASFAFPLGRGQDDQSSNHSKFWIHIFQIATSKENQPRFGLVCNFNSQKYGFPPGHQTSKIWVDRMTPLDFLNKVRPCCIPLATLDLYLLGFVAPWHIQHMPVGWWILQPGYQLKSPPWFFPGFLGYLIYIYVVIQMLIWRLFLGDPSANLGRNPLSTVTWPDDGFGVAGWGCSRCFFLTPITVETEPNECTVSKWTEPLISMKLEKWPFFLCVLHRFGLCFFWSFWYEIRGAVCPRCREKKNISVS